MFKKLSTVTAFALVLSGAVSGAALAQTSPSMKTIGTPAAAAKPEIVPSLFVLNSRGATLQGDTLTLTGVMPHSIIFADRPVRSAGHQLTADIIAEWGSGDDSFIKNPPNATISVFGKDGSVKDAVVVLKTPKLDGDKLTFNVQTLEGDISGGDGGAALFIHIIGATVLADVICLCRPPQRLPRRRDVCRRCRRGGLRSGCGTQHPMPTRRRPGNHAFYPLSASRHIGENSEISEIFCVSNRRAAIAFEAFTRLIYRVFRCGLDARPFVGPVLAMSRACQSVDCCKLYKRDTSMIKTSLLMATALALPLAFSGAASAQTPAKKPNIVVIMADDVGIWNISAYHRGMMGGSTPNIDRIAKEGALFTDYYAQQSCTAGRAAFILGQTPFRTGLLKVGLPAAKQGLQDKDPTIAELLKP